MYDELAARNDLECVTGTRALNGPGRSAPGLAHDLGNLLQAATSAINIIEREAGARTAHLRRAIDGARLSIGHASELVRRAIEGRLKGPDQEAGTDVEQCLGEIACVLASPSDQRVAIDYVIEEELPPVACDRVSFHNALLNLVLNARDAVKGNGRIAVQARKLAGDAGVEVSVADNGIGMSAATIERAFEPFFTTKCEGLGGIGLPMVERFVAAAGGTVAIDSEPGTGTIVRMRLPAAPSLEGTGEDLQ